LMEEERTLLPRRWRLEMRVDRGTIVVSVEHD
jgi:hypothetical protein